MWSLVASLDSFVAWRILIFGWYYSSMIYILMWRIINLLHNFILSRRMYCRILISLFCTLNFNAKVFILPRPHHLLFWRWGFREDLMFFRLLFVKWLHFVDGLSLVIWFIFSLGGFVSFACRMIYILIGRICIIYSSYDLYSHWENLYHLTRRMIYTPAWEICIILLVVWFIFPLREFVSFCLSYDLYSHWENHLACYMIYTPAWGICIILLIVWFIFPLGEFVSFCSSYDLYSHSDNLYHLTGRIIYTPACEICIILLVVWFIFPLGEFVSFCLSYDLYSHLGNLYHLLLERFLDVMSFWTFLRPCWYLH